MPACARCGSENPDGFRFCGSCGAPLAEEATARETRKVVTVLFSDVTGSTALGERLDAEHVRRVMSRYFAEARRIVQRHGGTVEKFVGDAVMAVFGIPDVHEDDALRAVRAACELREAVAALADELERERGVALLTRTGVNTGEVVVGEGETLATGDAVNVAARLEQAAAPGEVYIGAETHRLVRDAVESEPVEALALKGKSEPQPAFRVAAVLAGREGVARRVDAAFVGREREVRLLRDAFEQAVAGRACQLVTVLGPAGVGKSRLVTELVGGLGGDAVTLTGRCLPYGEGITYWPLAEMVDQLRSHDGASSTAADVAEALDAAIGGTDTSSTDEVARAVRRAFEGLARERPLVLVVDDLQWAKPPLLDLVEHLADWVHDAALTLVCLARPELLELRPGWGGGKVNALATLLRPLDSNAGAELVTSLLGAPAAPDVAERVLDAAEGNPLFIEELLRMLVEAGRLERRNGRWEATSGAGDTLAIPPTVQALLAARIDGLPRDERDALACAAVEGKVFHRAGLVELADVADIDGALEALVRKGVVTPAASQLDGGEAFAFRHQLLRDAAYDALSKSARADLHERFASWLDTAFAGRPESDEFAGYHLEQAYGFLVELGMDERATYAAGRAAARLEAAARRALGRGDVSAGGKLMRRALRLLPAADPRAARLLPTLARALVDEGRLDEAAAVLDEARGRSERHSDDSAAIDLRLADSYLAFVTDPLRARADAFWVRDVAIPALESLGDDAGLASAWYVVSLERWLAADAGGTAAAVERSAMHARRVGDRHAEVQALDWRYIALLFGSTPASDVLRKCDGALAGAHGLLEAFVRNARSAALAMVGRYGEAREEHANVVSLFEELGQRLTAAAVHGHIGVTIELLAGDPVRGEVAARKSLRLLEAMGERGYISNTAANLAHVLVEQDRLGEALEASDVARSASTPGDISAECEWRNARARALARLGQPAEAERLAREAVALGADSDWLMALGDTRVALADALEAGGRREEAVAELRTALALYERKEVSALSEAVRARLDALGSR